MTTATVMRFTAIPMGMLATAGLLLVMATLIQTDYVAMEPPESVTIGKIVMPEAEIIVDYESPLARPEAPPAPPEMPLISTEVQVDPAAPTGTGVQFTDPVDNTLSVGLVQPGDYLPIVKVAPQYPRTAIRRGLEGEVVVSFTVTRTGATRDIAVISAHTLDGNPTSVFNSAAIKAAERFKYKPRIENGVPLEVHGVQNRFIFELAE
ncbi:energy transducer TonB [Gilvimarinus agarilyticus]|uniref:energy transducer TonB n=1 Tax=Gilvimarinus agarilyticus TaxID=679259 RepID=UPI0005A206F1|nr:energy transducer TonB [Gilvimarinus agarilyticus]